MYNENGLSYSLLHAGLKSPLLACVIIGGIVAFYPVGEVKYVSFTFDDGYSSDYNLVLPLFTELGLTGSIYVPIDFLSAILPA